jgi:hypothetical protein
MLFRWPASACVAGSDAVKDIQNGPFSGHFGTDVPYHLGDFCASGCDPRLSQQSPRVTGFGPKNVCDTHPLPDDQKEKKLLPVKKTSSVSPIMPLGCHIRPEAKRRSRAHSVPRRSLFSFYPTPCNVIAMGNVEVSRRSLFSFWSQNRA